MAGYTDADSVQNPVTNAVIQTALLDQHRTNEQAIWYPPAVRARRGTNQSINDSTNTGIAADALDYDTHTIHSVVSTVSRFTVPANWGGLWEVGMCVNWQANGVGRRRAYIRLNGALILAAASQQMGFGGECEEKLSTQWSAVATDYFEFFVFQDSGAGLNLEPVDYACQAIWAKCARGVVAVAG